MIYLIDAGVCDSLLYADTASLLPEDVILLDWDKTTGFDIELGGETYSVDMELAEETDEEGSTLYDYAFSLDGEEADFTDVLQQLEALSSTGSAEGVSTALGEEITFTFHRDSENFAEVELVIYGYDSASCIAVLNGGSALFVPREDVQAIVDAVKALLARVCMWEGSDENKHTALLAALEVIDDPASVGIAGGLTLRTFTDSAKAPTTEMCFPSEHIFALGVTDMAKKIASNLNREYSAQDRQYRTLCIKNSVADDLFEIKGAGISDCRYKQLYHNTDYWPEGTKTPSKLYQQTSTGADYRHKDLMPLIRLPEMYYIAAECRISGPDKDLGEARSLLQEVRKARAVYEELDADLDEAGLMAQLEKEYRKEFICEGVVFYFYKRLGYEKLPRQSDVMSGSKVIDDAVYMLPYPDFEIQSGRVQ